MARRLGAPGYLLLAVGYWGGTLGADARALTALGAPGYLLLVVGYWDGTLGADARALRNLRRVFVARRGPSTSLRMTDGGASARRVICYWLLGGVGVRRATGQTEGRVNSVTRLQRDGDVIGAAAYLAQRDGDLALFRPQRGNLGGHSHRAPGARILSTGWNPNGKRHIMNIQSGGSAAIAGSSLSGGAVPLVPGVAKDVATRRSIIVTVPALAGSWAVLVGGLVLMGWTFDLEPLKRVVPAFAAMNPGSAVLFILSGAALELVVRHRSNRLARALAATAAGIIFSIAGAELMEHLGFWHSPFDEWLFASKLPDTRVIGMASRMALNTAIGFILVACSLVIAGRVGCRRYSQGIAVVLCFTALLPITGYAYGVNAFSRLGDYFPMALHSAVTFLVLGIGLFFAVPGSPLAEAFLADGARGLLARRLFPLAAGVTFLTGWLVLPALRDDADPAFGSAVYAVVLVIVLSCLVRWMISNVSKLEAERDAAHARLQNLSRRKDEMIAVVSHDLCSPLTGFRVVVDLLREKADASSDELLDVIDHSAQRMVAMVRGLLDVSKLQADQTELERENLLVSDVVRDCIEPLSITARAKEIDVEMTVAEAEPQISADPLRVAQIFNNLLSNAVKFTAPGGKVMVNIDRQSGNVRVAVEDTGLGIAAPELPHIFERFHQASTKATAGEMGAGLGLAIVRELVLLHNGRIEVSSEVGRGTTFTVYLPERVAAAAGSALPTVVEAGPRVPALPRAAAMSGRG